ncbi:MAG: type 2 isopentenyl-diphosphate Delta-isomerase [Chloroflexi bacterium]|nr:type 2 isopentenyl-diphosphate Delta-isomerase [Chloroflexota bacterium]
MNEVEARKLEHLEVATTLDVNTHRGPGWQDIHLLHQPLPELDVEELNLSIELLGRRLRYPVVISAMTGGHERAHELNAILARAAQRFGLAMGLGSQRAALKDPNLAYTYRVAREQAPDALLIANIGAAQLIPQSRPQPLTVDQLQGLVEMIGADALAIHLNWLEEAIQTEGDRRARGCLEAIEHVAHSIRVPLIVKETGAGLSRPVGKRAIEAGAAALDVGGVGGTSFAAVEAIRAERRGDARGARLGDVFRDWGIPTAVAVVEVADLGRPVVATGGLRTGLDAAKALALGATAVGIARPLLQAAVQGDDALAAWLTQFLEELRVAMFLTGSARPEQLRQARRVITGETAAWLQQLGYLK